ncbi:MAG: DUF2490 domain-containing protein [Bacteroidales bacterium]|nr:DUF2490 domain-containing protein [Bacteroidales bacterium]
MKHLLSFSLLVAALLCPLVSIAQEERENDFGIWGSVDMSYTFKQRVNDSSDQKQASRWSAGVRFEYRSKELSHQTNLWFVRPYVGFRATKWLRFALYYDYFKKPTIYQHRILFDATESLSRSGLTVSLRERFIVAYAPETDKWSWVLRPKLTAKYHIGDTRFSPYMAFELYTNHHWTMMHNFVGTNINLGKGSSLDLFYMFGLNNGTNRQDHILGVGYGLKL